MTNPVWLMFVLSWLGLTWSIYRLFNLTEDVVNDEVKESLSKWLMNLKVHDNYNWATIFISVFDNVFTDNHFSRKCFIRSCFASLLAYILIGIILGITDINVLEPGIDEVIGFISIATIINLIPDYISLLQTRYFLNFVSTVSNPLVILMFIFLDVIVTAIIFVVFGYLTLFVSILVLSPLSSISLSDLFTPREWYSLLMNSYHNINVESTLGAALRTGFFSTFFTSCWLWIFLLSSSIFKLFSLMSKLLKFFQDVLNIEERPFSSLGFMMISIVTLIYIVWAIVLFL